jgi:hypothetical protein
VDQAAIVQHRQVEAAAVPGHDLRCQFLDAVEEALDDLALADFGSASDQTRKPSSLRSAQEITTTRCRCRGRKVAAVLRPLALEGELGHFGVGQRAGNSCSVRRPAMSGMLSISKTRTGVMGGNSRKSAQAIRRFYNPAMSDEEKDADSRQGIQSIEVGVPLLRVLADHGAR